MPGGKGLRHPAPPRTRRGRLAALAVGTALCALPACRPATKEAADREAYGAIEARRHCVPEVAGSLDLEHSECDALAARKEVRDPAGRRLTLSEALELSARASRQLRERREDVYLAALALSDARHGFRAVPFAVGTGELASEDGERTASGSLDAGVSRAFERGGNAVLALATDVLRNLTGSPLQTAQSLLTLDVLLPLARGSGRRIAREGLTQAERDTVYALRTYARSQQELTLAVASAFYGVLQSHDIWSNEERTFQSLSKLQESQEARGARGAGTIPEFQVSQARQDTLRADDRRQRAHSDYERALDALLLLLGLPVSAPLEPAQGDLAKLAAQGLRPAPFGPEQALEEARGTRLDLANAREQVEDARRKVEVARDGMGTQVDLALGADLSTPSTQPFNLREASRRLSAGLVVDLPLDRTPERNAFRGSLIQAVRAWRALEALEDGIERQLRQDLRAIEETRRSHAILTEGVTLAERRVENTRLLQERGDVAIREVLEAEDDLLQARNDLTRALVDHAVAWLQLELDLGRLRVDGGSAPARSCAPPPPPPPPLVCPCPPAPPPAPTGSAGPAPAGAK